MIIVNPGSGPVCDTTESNAIDNIRHFITDNKVDDVKFIRIPKEDYGDGRYAFLIWKNYICHEIQMPGVQLDKVRYMGTDEQNPWHFPRLYVDGSSWLWEFAIGLTFDMEANDELQRT